MEVLSLREIQLTELQILVEFKKICNEHKLRFYLCGGTLLGAARHHGFIPWDDDIDVMMPRPDYMELMKLVREFNILPDYLEMFSYELGNADYPFGKLANTNTHLDQRFAEDESLSHLWIDIMPVDGLPESINDVKRIYQTTDRLRRIILLCWAKLGEGTTPLRKLSKYILVPIAKAFGARYWCSKIDKIARQYDYNTSQYVGVVSWGIYGAGERCIKEDFDRSVEVEFEGYKMPAISCWDLYLKGLYGDYMQIPPENERKVHMVKAWVD